MFPNRRVVSAPVSMLVAAALVGVAAIAPAAAASRGCFTPDEAKAAHFRALQQELHVAALNCQTVDPADPTFSTRYNDFIGKFDVALSENAQALRTHFSRSGENFDRWMTSVANDAGRRVFAEADYCQRAWENMDKALALEPHEVVGFASNAEQASLMVPVCSEAKPVTKAKTQKVKAHAKPKKAPAKPEA